MYQKPQTHSGKTAAVIVYNGIISQIWHVVNTFFKKIQKFFWPVGKQKNHSTQFVYRQHDSRCSGNAQSDGNGIYFFQLVKCDP